LPHVDRAGQIRKAAVNKAEKSVSDEDDEDISSDEEEHEEIDSDDVDSDELDSGDEEPVEMVEGGQGGLSGQQDFVHV
jgi:hypothetical protein